MDVLHVNELARWGGGGRGRGTGAGGGVAEVFES